MLSFLYLVLTILASVWPPALDAKEPYTRQVGEWTLVCPEGPAVSKSCDIHVDLKGDNDSWMRVRAMFVEPGGPLSLTFIVPREAQEGGDAAVAYNNRTAPFRLLCGKGACITFWVVDVDEQQQVLYDTISVSYKWEPTAKFEIPMDDFRRVLLELDKIISTPH